jgi:glycosyltransferase involved in cell wall biosynthesis
MRKKIIFLCQHVSPDENRAQHNRVRFLCDHYCLYIVSTGPVSCRAGKNAKSVFISPFKKKGLKGLSFFWGVWRVLQLARRNGVEVLYSTYEPRTIILAWVVMRLSKVILILDLWDDPEKELMIAGIKEGLRNKINMLVKKFMFHGAKLCLKDADKIILGLVPEGVVEKYSLSGKELLPITNGINLKFNFQRGVAQNCKTGEVTVFYCGTVDKIRLEGLRECLKHVFEKWSGRLTLVITGSEGSGGYSWLEDQLRSFGDQLALQMNGRQPYREVIKSIGNSDICICPYPDKLDIAATYPVKLFDYMIMGKPIVASRLPGIKRILTHGVDGLLFTPGHYDEMAECIIRLGVSDALSQMLSQNAQKTALKYSWDNIHEKIYRFI